MTASMFHQAVGPPIGVQTIAYSGSMTGTTRVIKLTGSYFGNSVNIALIGSSPGSFTISTTNDKFGGNPHPCARIHPAAHYMTLIGDGFCRGSLARLLPHAPTISRFRPGITARSPRHHMQSHATS
jgi:hypothetical protein